MNPPTKEKGYIRLAWILLVPGGLLDLVEPFSFAAQNGWILSTLDWVFEGLIGVAGIVQLGVGPTAFRKGSKRGWYLILAASLAAVLVSIYNSIVAVGFPLVGLLLFFPHGGIPSLVVILTIGSSSRRRPYRR